MASFSRNYRQGLSLVSILLIASVLTACGDKPKSTQVAATVNADEITVSQVNTALSTVPVVPGKTLEEAKQEVLENLIVQNLADQQAIKMKLDRKPAVMQSIESAKNTILARAYMDPIMAAISKPTEAEAHKFFVDHPELFSKRHIFNLRELEAETKPELAALIREMAGKGETLEAIAAKLKGMGVASTMQSAVKPAEQLPLEIVTALEKLSAGKMLVVELSKTISVLQVLGFKSEPVTEAMATPVIYEYLMNARRKETLEKEIKSLKALAKIEYFGDFQSGVKAATAEATPATAEVASAPSSAPDLAKGVAALK